MAKSALCLCVSGNIDTQYEGYTNENDPYTDYLLT